MSDINWKENAVCYAGGKFWMQTNKVTGCLANENGTCVGFKYLLECPDFQLNEIRTGDFIPASELDTEQKYNEVVEVFELSGFGKHEIHLGYNKHNSLYFTATNVGYCYSVTNGRQLTYSQIIAIGKLKRMMLNRAKSVAVSGADLTANKPKSAVDYLTECVEVQKQRGEQYDSTGTGERSFNAAAKAYNALTGGKIKGSDVCLILTCVKAVRQYSNPNRLHEDSLLDLVSYASLWAEELNKELK